MSGLRRWGGVAALVSAACYVFAFVWALAVLVPAGYETGDFEPGDAVAFIADNQATMFIWTLVIYLIAGAALVVLTLALYDRLKALPGHLAQVGAAFGLIWATLVIAAGMLIILDLGVVADLFAADPEHAETVWISLNAVEEGLGGGIELPGGLWLLLVCWAAIGAEGFPKAVGYLGVFIGVIGVLTIIPATAEVFTSAFGVLLIVWFTWLGIAMLRDDTAEFETKDSSDPDRERARLR